MDDDGQEEEAQMAGRTARERTTTTTREMRGAGRRGGIVGMGGVVRKELCATTALMGICGDGIGMGDVSTWDTWIFLIQEEIKSEAVRHTVLY